MKLKRMVAVAAVAISILSSSLSVYAAEWQKDNVGWWYQQNDNSYPAATWSKIGEKWYYFNQAGYMHTGWFNENGTWYYLTDAGDMKAATWSKIGEKWYYFNQSGSMKTGWFNENGTWYFLAGSGEMQTGWVLLDSWYYLNGSGAMHTGWLQQGSNWYYLDGNGRMQTGSYTVDGVPYTTDSSGAILNHDYSWYPSDLNIQDVADNSNLDLDYIRKEATRQLRDAGYIFIPEDMNKYLAAGKVSQSSYDEYYPNAGSPWLVWYTVPRLTNEEQIEDLVGFIKTMPVGSMFYIEEYRGLYNGYPTWRIYRVDTRW